jgi:N-acetylmuramoyl-L-alanine amidase
MIRTIKPIHKRILLPILVLILLCLLPLSAVAAQKVEATVVEGAAITIDGKKAKLEDSVLMLDGRLFVPVTRLVGMFGATVTWDQDNEAVTINTVDGNKSVLSNGVPVVYFNDNRYRLDETPFMAEGRMYIPLRYAAELMQATVKWHADTQVAELTSVQSTEEVIRTILDNEAEPFTEDDFRLLAKLTQVEAGYETYDGQLAVANVVLNRVKDSRFPNTIYDVIYSGKQFPVAHNGLLDKSKPNASVLRAAKDALNGKNNVEGAVYFFNPKVSKGSFWTNLKVVDTIGTHRFAK